MRVIGDSVSGAAESGNHGVCVCELVGRSGGNHGSVCALMEAAFPGARVRTIRASLAGRSGGIVERTVIVTGLHRPFEHLSDDDQHVLY